MKDLLKKDSYYYDLPEELIAQYPLENRSSSRLLRINKSTSEIEHAIFSDIIDFFKRGDVLVLNSSKVIPARLLGYKETGARVEVFLISPISPNLWTCLVKPGRRMKINTIIQFSESLSAKVVDYAEDGGRRIQFYIKGLDDDAITENMLMEEIKKVGEIPLPPYISRKAIESDKYTYQTVYANEDGSVAAPTAGLHFTDDLLKKIENKGVTIVKVVLHVGLGTFRPVQAESILEHKMHSEFATISDAAVKIINDAKLEKRRIIAVGTTTIRTLESFASNKKLNSGSKWTDIFIYPGKEIQIADVLITNFHMPESTLMMLVSAFAGYDLIMQAYEIAVREKYRFFSYGDACLIY
ncbi:MAG TPA: tRNA preQ1(34) S-adenosylmethionine ribosyltransferase-isomerase QueA [Candidatus Cloacimonadota bacterium]|nr:tRNA preQ1(34) S-adenosylmethionine ribosyltransferase-isomerase QueA [Candidatus Cloacimonadota bacterium]